MRSSGPRFTAPCHKRIDRFVWRIDNRFGDGRRNPGAITYSFVPRNAMDRIAGLAAYPKARSEPAVIFSDGLLDMLQNLFGTASTRLNLDGRPWSSAQFLVSG